jgi:hypothetical protein
MTCLFDLLPCYLFALYLHFFCTYQECTVPPVLLRIAVRFGSIHPYCTDLWRKWAAHKEQAKHTVIDNSSVEDSFKPFHMDGTYVGLLTELDVFSL